MSNPFATFRLHHRAFKAWPLFVAALVVLWSVSGQAPLEVGSLLAVIHVVYLVGVVLLLIAAITITLRHPPIGRTLRSLEPALPQSSPCDHTSKADTPPPRHTVRD